MNLRTALNENNSYTGIEKIEIFEPNSHSVCDTNMEKLSMEN